MNGNGGGPASAQSNAVTPAAPSRPARRPPWSPAPATKSAQVTWTRAEDDGGSPITGYTVTPFIGSTAQTRSQVGATATSTTITGLTNGTTTRSASRRPTRVGTSPSSAASNAVDARATLFDFATPATVDSGDGGAVELGVKFRADLAGTVTGVRFYKSATNTGTHIGSLWTATGTRLAQATFTGESAYRLAVRARFSSPVAITPGTTYVASYHAPNGHYSVTARRSRRRVDNAPLHALANARRATASTSTALEPVPDELVQRRQLLGRRDVRPGRRRRARRPA